MKKLIVLLLAASMTASLTACGGSSTQGPTAANTESSVESEIASETAAPEETVTESLSETETAAGETGTDSSESISSPEAALLSSIYNAFAEDQKFPIGGGDSEHMTTDAPGAFDVSKTEELTSTLSLPESETTHIDDAASMIHMMNANTFTGAAYHLTGDVSADEFADALKEGILAKQWICGMPDTLVVINVDGQYVIAAYGADDLVETFKDNALSALDGAEAIIDTPVVEG